MRRIRPLDAGRRGLGLALLLVLLAADARGAELDFLEALPLGANVNVATLAASPDGRHVYVTIDVTSGDDGVQIYARNASDGTLALVDTFDNTDAGVFSSPRSVVVSPDGATVFIANAGAANQLVALSRNATTGALALLDAVSDGEGGAILAQAQDVALNADSTIVYVTSFLDDAISIFGWNAQTGQFSFVDALAEGEGGIVGMVGAFEIALTGGLVTVTASFDDSLAVFEADGETGALTWLGSFFDGEEGVDGLDSPSDIVATPWNGVVVAGRFDATLASFDPAAVPRMLAYAALPFVYTNPRALGVAPDFADRFYVADGADGGTLAAYQLDAGTLSIGPELDAAVASELNIPGYGLIDAIALAPGEENLYAITALDTIVNFATVLPEPGAALVGASAVAALAGLRRARRRRA